MDRSAKFWDRVAERYAKQPVADEAAYQKKLKITQEHFRPDMEVLEFGCGTGSTAIVHAPFVKHILATDVSSKMIEIARGKADAAGIDNISFECAAVDDINLPDQSLGAVLGHNILHLLNNWEVVIARVHTMLKPGGNFISSTACIGDFNIFFRIIAPLGKYLRLFPPVMVFTQKELEDSLTRAGFEIDYRWLPGKNKAAFIVARKAGPT